MASFITNFQSPVELDDLIERFEVGGSNIDILFAHAIVGKTEWTVHREAATGDRVFFMCAKTSIDHIRHCLKRVKELGNPDLIEFAEKQKEKYLTYHGKIVAMGRVGSKPWQDKSEFEFQYWRSPWYAVIESIQLLSHPIDLSEFRDLIKVSRTGAITKLDVEKEQYMLQLIQNRNPDLKYV